VYCPGTINLKPFARLTEQDFMHDWQVNVLGAVRVLQQAIKSLKKAQGASVVLYSTVAARVGMNFHASVATAKSAVEGLALSLAAEYASGKIRFNVVAPSLTDTPLAAALLSSPEKREASDKRHPLGRVGTPEELAAITAFLLSNQSAWISGQVLGVDGGMSSLKVV
jgi:NAD(P)-dependent dehydrogenase (short-subunit alcohol dehydrogenase family)